MVLAPPLRILREPAAAAALLDPERRRLVEALAEAPASAAGLARRLGEKRQRINYHLRLLEEAGLLEPVEAQERAPRAERVLRPAARRFLLDPAAVGRLGRGEPGTAGDRFSAACLVALAARAIRELADLMDRAAAGRMRLATVSFSTRVRLGSPAQLAAFTDDLTRAIGEVVARHQDDGADGRWFRVIGGAYPAPPRSPREEVESDD